MGKTWKSSCMLFIAVLLLSCLCLAATAQIIGVNASNGVSISQFSTTNVGMISVNSSTLDATTGIANGYVSLYDPSQAQPWVVQNMPINVASGYTGNSMMFDLGTSGVSLASDSLAAVVSANPIAITAATPELGPIASYSVVQQGYSLPTFASAPSLLSWSPTGATSVTWQAGHTNVAADTNQCGPAAVANSLDWLRATQGLPLSSYYQNIPGDGTSGTPIPANSLVANMDVAMKRAPATGVTSAQFLSGKLTFINNQGLGPLISTEYWEGNQTGEPVGTWQVGNAVATDVSQYIAGYGTIGWAKAEVDWVVGQVQQNEDVEGTWESPATQHVFEIVGAGYTDGVPWVTEMSDADQNGGSAGTNWNDGGIVTSYLTPGFSQWNTSWPVENFANIPSTPYMDMVTSESTPEFSTIAMMVLGPSVTLASALRRRRRARKA